MSFPATDNVYDVRKTYSQYQTTEDRSARRTASKTSYAIREGRECIATRLPPVNRLIAFFYRFLWQVFVPGFCNWAEKPV